MAAWQIWLIISGVCFIIEIATIGFLVFWFAVAALITCLLSLFIPNIIIQTAIFLVLSVSLIFLTRPFADKMNKKDNTVTNFNKVIGMEAIVTKEINANGSTSVGQVKVVSGDIWSAITSDYTDSIPVGSKVKVLKIDGVKLVVTPIVLSSTLVNK